MGTRNNHVFEASEFIAERTSAEPEIGLILGSGLGDLAEEIDDGIALAYEDIPGFKPTTVEGHAGKLVLGTLQGSSVAMMQGRYHFYEGHELDDLIFPVRAMGGLGIGTILVTNASGAINESFRVGDLTIIKDHINFLGTNPLIGPNDDDIGPRFVDMTYAYDRELKDLAERKATEENLDIERGVYLATTGPSYETPAEVEMFKKLGADLVGMSTVPEVIAANHCGMDVLGLSCVTNMAAGVLDQSLDHDEVIETTERVKNDFKGLVKAVLSEL